jgi:hypothetical protein
MRVSGLDPVGISLDESVGTGTSGMWSMMLRSCCLENMIDDGKIPKQRLFAKMCSISVVFECLYDASICMPSVLWSVFDSVWCFVFCVGFRLDR